MRDALETVLRIRRVTLDDAKRALAATLRAEEAAQIEASKQEAAIAIEADIASDLGGDDSFVEAFAAWLPGGRARAAAARAAHEQAQSEVAKARAALTAARAAAEAASNLLDRQAALRQAEAAGHAQAEQDDAALRRRPPED